ncbi:MAG: lipopolysaccharide assembly protein LapA domain-containing protein [Thermodesulfobacteriota bacterium]|nr:lipopolysaccharide assembly protein LapA domain-containing protein [Thermodesulfobacteriota bacterium]
MKLFYTIIVMLVMIFIITFSLANTELVQLKYYGFIDASVEAYLLIFISFGVGIVFAGFMGIVERYRLSRKAARLTKKVKQLEREQAKGEIVPLKVEEETAEKA